MELFRGVCSSHKHEFEFRADDRSKALPLLPLVYLEGEEIVEDTKPGYIGFTV